ncbi:MAG: putative LPS assembly protein LptD [Bacteroidota bacterium]|nr:putative LPS assembly protein LptD [Bacteroidota bacterium]
MNTTFHIAALLLLCAGMSLLMPAHARAQGVETDRSGDSTRVMSPSPTTTERIPPRLSPDDSLVTFADSLVADSLVADTLGLPPDSLSLWARNDAVDTIIVYSAKDSVVYLLDDKRMLMYDEAAIDYGKTAIRASRITINWDNSTIEATGVPDSSAGGKLTGTPVLKEGSDEYVGEAMTFNFKTEKGVITHGETAIDDGFYLGERIKRISPDEYFIGGGKYTTCDNPDHKHYYFGSAEMKFVPDEVVVARPITLYVEDIPLLWLPFAVIPTSKGRSSGIIVPSFGESATRGRYLLRGGYYLAMSDYWDLALTGDVYAKGGYLLRTDVRYALRYNFNGSVSASYGRQRYNVGNVFAPDDQPGTDWSLTINHDQEIDPTSRINVNFSFLTNSYYQNFSNNLNELLNQTARSTAMYSKNWEGTSASMSVGVTRDQNLVNGTYTMSLPDISFNQSQIYPFRGSDGFGDRWYEMIGFNYGGKALNRIELKEYQTGEYDTLTQEFVKQKERFDRRGMRHSFSLLATPKLGYFTLSPSFSYDEVWYDHRMERFYNPVDSVVEARDVQGFFTYRTFRASLTASTKLYGMFEPGVLGIIGFRHTLQPSVSYNWNPDFSKESWGYWQSYVDSTGNDVRYDPYTGFSYRPGEVFGGVGSGESQTIGMSLSNIFEMKLNPRADDTTQTPRKFQLFTLSATSNYNMVKDSMKLAPVNLSFRTSIQGLLDIYGGATFSPYAWQPSVYETDAQGVRQLVRSGHEIDRFLWEEEGAGIARMTNFTINLSTTLTSDMFATASVPAADTTQQVVDEEEEAGRRRTPTVDPNAPYRFRIPWSISLGYDYSMSQFNPENKTRNSGLRANMTFSLTPSWHFTMSGYYDLVNKEIGAPQIGIRRDLHCWEMDFNWVPTGPYRNFYFVLRLKAAQLKDIKLEKRGSDREVYGY